MRKRTVRAAALVFTWFLFYVCLGISASALSADPYIIKLESDDETEFRIWCVTNKLSGTPLSDEFLDMTLLTISCGGTEYYKGTIRDMPTPAIETITIAADDRIWIDVLFSFSKNADNRFQGISYNLLWEFEASGKIDMTGGNTLYSNLNVNPGDEYGFSIIVENGNPPPLPTPSPDPPDPSDPPDPENTDNPNAPPLPIKPEETDEPDNSDDTDDSDQPDISDDTDDSAQPDISDDTDDSKQPDISDNTGNSNRPGTSDDTNNIGDTGIPNSDKDGYDDYDGIKTGDYSTPAKTDESLPLLIISIVFLMVIICVFIRIILAEQKRQAGK